MGARWFFCETKEIIDEEHHAIIYGCDEPTSVQGEYDIGSCLYFETCDAYAARFMAYYNAAYEIPLGDLEFRYDESWQGCLAYYNGERWERGIGGNEHALWLSRVLYNANDCPGQDADPVWQGGKTTADGNIQEDDLQ